MKYVSLFSGCGGIDIAIDRAGGECLLQAEKDANALSVLRYHWPDVRKVDDVRSVRSSLRLGSVDLVAGGPPCQDYSVAGKRGGLAGDRGAMWWEFHRIVGELAPTFVLVENVPGMLSSNKGRDFGTILRSLAELGYGWAYRILDAQFDRVPQRRRRVFIVGCAGGLARRAAEILFESDRLPWDSPPSREEGARIAASLTAGVAASRGVSRPGRRREDDFNIVNIAPPSAPELSFALTAKGGRFDPSNEVMIAHSLRGEGFDASEDGTGRGTPLVPIAFAQNTRDEVRELGGNIAGALSAQPGMKQQTYIAFSERSRDGATAIEFEKDGITLAIKTGTQRQQGVLGAFGVRRLLPIECERCQGMPDDFTRYGINEKGETVELSDSARYRLIGNSVAVPVVEWIAKRIAEAT